ncbi:MAG: ATP-binding protein [Cyclobacteriaceae bacterium]
MEDDNSLNTFIAILTGIVLMVIMAVFIVTIVVIHRQRQIRNRHKIQILKADYENTILNAEKEIREETLQFVSQELHDNIGQLLSLAKLVLNHSDPSSVYEGKKLINQIIREVRALSKSINRDYIRDIKFEDFLSESLQRIENSGFCKTRLSVSGPIDELVKGDKKLVLIRVVQECINNAIKHASPTLLSVKIFVKKDVLHLWVVDDGKGFDINQKSNGLGIINLGSRVKAIEGNLKVNSAVNKGTDIKIEVKV